MGFLSHRVKQSDLEAGDHIYTWRTPVFAYSHHGIYIGRDKVVHFTQNGNLSSGDSTSFCSSSSFTKVTATCLDFEDCEVLGEQRSGVVMSCLNCFLANGSLYRYQYGVRGVTLVTKLRSGVCTTAKSDPPEAVIHRAMYLLDNGFGKYDVLANNCEDFALYCKTGLQRGRKGKGSGGGGEHGCSGQVLSIIGVHVSFIISLPVKIFATNPDAYGATAAANYTLNRYSADIGVRDDAVKVEVEDIAAFHGNVRGEVRDDAVKVEVEDIAAFHGNVRGEDGVDRDDDDQPKKG